MLEGQKNMTPARKGKFEESIEERIEKIALVNTLREIGRIVDLVAWKVVALTWIVVLAAIWLLLNAFACMTFLGHEAMLTDTAVPAAKNFRGNFATLPRSAGSLLHILTLRDWPELLQPLVQDAPTTLVLVLCHALVTAAMLLGVWCLGMRDSGKALEAGSALPRRRARPAPRHPRPPRRGQHSALSERPARAKPSAESLGSARPSPPARSARPGSAKPNFALS